MFDVSTDNVRAQTDSGVFQDRSVERDRPIVVVYHRAVGGPKTSIVQSDSPKWFREAEFWLLAVLAIAIYVPRMTTLPIRGEEPRRARVAQEMLDSGDWIVPRQQGELFADRPPLGEWLIALATLLCGEMSTFAVRLPAVTATCLTGLVLYGYTRMFLSRGGALAAGLAYLTFGQVLQIGRLAESEAVFILTLSSALFLWHAGYVRGWRSWLTWSAGYAGAALAGLTKGPQGPIYFGAAIGLHLALRRDWRFLFSRGHAIGIVVFSVIFGAWLVPFYLRTDPNAVREILCGVSEKRFGGRTSLVNHMFVYPLQILVCTLPWSPLLARFVVPRFWSNLGEARPHAAFLFAALAATFPSVWLASEALNRHYMGLYPCLAVLCGLVIERCWQAAPASELRRSWKWYQLGLAAAIIGGTAAVAVASWSSRFRWELVAQPVGFAAALAAAGAVTISAIVISARSLRARMGTWSLVATAAFLGFAYTGAVINAQSKVSEDAALSVSALKQKLPAEAHLVSFGRLDHVFTFHYKSNIPVVAWPDVVDAGRSIEYFCFSPSRNMPEELPFPWQPIAVVSCERNQIADPHRTVIVGRRVDTATATLLSLDGKTRRE